MESFSLSAIIEILNEREEGEEHPPMFYSPTFLGYMVALLEPSARALSELQSGAEIRAWVTQAFPDATEPIETTLNSIDQMFQTNAIGNACVTQANSRTFSATDTDFEYVNLLRRGVIQACIEELGHSAISEALRVDDDQVLPWDLNEAILSGSGFSQLILETSLGPDDLPVMVQIGSNTFHHPMSCELAMGIILMGQITHQNYQLIMYGHELIYFRRDIDRFRLNQNKPMWGPYLVEINNIEYQFNSVAWLQGLATGALWAGVDYVPYLTRVEHYNSDTDTIDTLIPTRNQAGSVELRPAPHPI